MRLVLAFGEHDIFNFVQFWNSRGQQQKIMTISLSAVIQKSYNSEEFKEFNSIDTN